MTVMALTGVSWTEATGHEHETPMAITSTSATEKRSFRECRRRWFLTVVHRLDPQEGNPNYFLGTIYHEALEAYYRAQMAGRKEAVRAEASMDAYECAFRRDIVAVKDQLGFLWPYHEEHWYGVGDMGMSMLEAYLDAETRDHLFDEVIAVEERVNIEIDSDSPGFLSVQADAVGRQSGLLVVADHKTASRVVSSAHLDLDDQLTSEARVWLHKTGELPDRVAYNVSYKKVAQPPALLRGGRLSTKKNQNTTPALYRAAVKDAGLKLADYAEHLAYLEARQSPFFRREYTIRTNEQMAAFDASLREEWEDMVMVAGRPQAAYINPSDLSCGSCPVRVVCTTMQDGGNVEAVIRAGFVVAPPRRPSVLE